MDDILELDAAVPEAKPAGTDCGPLEEGGRMPTEKRRQERYPVQVPAVIECADGRRLPARSVNVSGRGILLELTPPCDLRVGESVGCALWLYAKKPPQLWGKGRVVRVENCRVAVDFQ